MRLAPNPWRGRAAALALSLLGALAAARGAEAPKEVALQDAIKARTEARLLMQDVGELNPEMRKSMRRVIAEAEGEQLAGDLLLKKDKYAEALGAFEKAAALCRQALGAQKLLDALAAARKQAVEAMGLARSTCRTRAVPHSFEEGSKALAEADKAVERGELDAAKSLFGTAAELFATARAQTELANAQEDWNTAQADIGNYLAAKSPEKWNAARKKAEEAAAYAAAGDGSGAVRLFKEATQAVRSTAGLGPAAEGASDPAALAQALESAIAGLDKFDAEWALGRLEKVAPDDGRLADWRKRVTALPELKDKLALDLGGGVKMEMVLIRPGSFTMGDERGDPDERPAHKVTLTRPFYLGKHEVTQEQWQAVLGTTPSDFKGAQNPVDSVSWNDCQVFLKLLSERHTELAFRLPTESEWEYACRAGSTTRYCFGDSEENLGDYAWFDGNSQGRPHPVGQKKPNAWGLHDMHGSVWEWCLDFYGAYGGEDQVDPKGPLVGKQRALCGGAWNLKAGFLRSSFRNAGDPAARGANVGFRVAAAP